MMTLVSRSVEALRGPGGPLEGMDLEVRGVPYDWTVPSLLRGLRDREGTPWAVSSEGGLFEYGPDEEILANLEVLKGIAGSGCFLTGSVLRDNEVTRVMGRNNRLAIRCRGMGAFPLWRPGRVGKSGGSWADPPSTACSWRRRARGPSARD